MKLLLHPKFTMLSKKQRFLVGISGGRDSVALLYALLDAGYNDLVLCHLNHQLRGDESDGDAKMVRRLAQQHQLDCHIETSNIMQHCEETGDSMELAARHARHLFFSKCATHHNAKHILLAHHADDQAETVLFNLLRGSGGLKGIPYSSDISVKHHNHSSTITLLRPLLENTRKTIDAYLDERKIPYREDSTNAQPIATRNRLRNEALPLLQSIMGRDVRSAILRATKIADKKDEALREILSNMELTDPQGRLFLPKLSKLPTALCQMALHDYLKEHKISDISQKLLEQSESLIHHNSPAKINLPGNAYLRRKEQRIFIDRPS